ncbi:hypothetical protein A2U01_0055874, partial [Trifolium medium]|nr:hypothetical protein [Trifolium medium]
LKLSLKLTTVHRHGLRLSCLLVPTNWYRVHWFQGAESTKIQVLG